MEMHSNELTHQRFNEIIIRKQYFIVLPCNICIERANVVDIDVVVWLRHECPVTNFSRKLAQQAQGREYIPVNLKENIAARTQYLPSLNDVKDDLVKMILWTNIKEAWLEN